LGYPEHLLVEMDRLLVVTPVVMSRAYKGMGDKEDRYVRE
jgi:hypothetical protein